MPAGKCAYCGEELDQSPERCAYCGRRQPQAASPPLQQLVSTPPQAADGAAAQQAAGTTMYCPHCDAKNYTSATSCKRCNNPLHEAPAPRAAEGVGAESSDAGSRAHQWEYLHVEIEWHQDSLFGRHRPHARWVNGAEVAHWRTRPLQASLNEFGEQGWELAAAITFGPAISGGGSQLRDVLFKRPSSG
jgi:hypothetical protein